MPAYEYFCTDCLCTFPIIYDNGNRPEDVASCENCKDGLANLINKTPSNLIKIDHWDQTELTLDFGDDESSVYIGV